MSTLAGNLAHPRRELPGDSSDWLTSLYMTQGGQAMTDGAKAIVGLAEAVESLRAELMTAAEAGRNQPMQFSVEPVELTAQVAVSKDASGKIGWHLLGVGGSYQSANTQTLTLRLAPVWKRPDGTLERDFTIVSAGPAGDVIGPHSLRSSCPTGWTKCCRVCHPSGWTG
jgi:hypothetical protein